MKISKWKRSDAFRAFFYNVPALIIFLLIFQPYFELNDDSTMAGISEGAAAGYSDHLVFINVLYGKIIKALNILMPEIRWYSVVFYVLLFISFTVITYVFLKHKGRKAGGFISVSLLAVFGYYTYVVVQFTRVSGITTTAGILLIFYTLEKEHRKSRKTFLLLVGGILAVIGSLLRFNMFLLTTAVLCGLGLWKLLALYQEGKWKNCRKILPYTAALLAVLLVSLGCRLYDSHVYNSDPQWKAYTEYNNLRYKLLDYGFPDYEENKKLYEALGMDASDVAYYEQHWNFSDPEIFNTDTMEKLISVQPDKTVNLEFLKSFVEQISIGLFKEPSFVFLCLLLLLCCFQFRRNWIMILYAVISGVGVQFYLFYQGRYLMTRVDDVLWFAMCCLLLYTCVIQNEEKEFLAGKQFLAVGILLVLNANVLIPNILSDIDEEFLAQEKETLELMSQDTEHIYFSETLGLSTDYYYDIWTRIPEYKISNLYYLGGWQTNSPLTNQIKESYGIENPFRESVNQESVYILLESGQDMIQHYIQRHYNNTAVLQLVKDMNGHRFYRVTDQNWKPEERPLKSFNGVIDENIALEQTSKDTYKISGYMYHRDRNSYKQKFYIRLENKITGEVRYTCGVQTESETLQDIQNGKYSSISQEIQIPAEYGNHVRISLILESEQEWFEKILKQ